MVSMINSSFYVKMQESFFGFMNLLENQLERIHAEHYEHGYEVFKVGFSDFNQFTSNEIFSISLTFSKSQPTLFLISLMSLNMNSTPKETDLLESK